MHRSDIQRWTFLLFIALVSVAFAWIVSPFFGAVFWGVVLAIVLNPLYERTLELCMNALSNSRGSGARSPPSSPS